VRITDPNGNFDWRDSQNFMWGKYRTNPTHGFGGITGQVRLVASDKISINDVFVKNKPAVNQIDLAVSIQSQNDQAEKGSVVVEIKEKKTGRQVYRKQSDFEAKNGENMFSDAITVATAKYCAVDDHNL